ncbi:hypothetical protein MWLf4_0479 [Limosilactobacillus fermentum]|nr:hypothetical protein MWLf4_0479 [Limosilactobacillus fermentum]
MRLTSSIDRLAKLGQQLKIKTDPQQIWLGVGLFPGKLV